MEVSEVLPLSELGIFTSFTRMTLTLLIFVVSILVSFAVSSDMFMQVGTSVQLNPVYPGQDFEVFLWLFHNNTIGKYYKDISKLKLYSPYEGRVEFNEEAHSLILKNLQRNDTGFYEAKTIGETNKVVVKYRLTVLDPVETPVLTTTPHMQSSEACNMTLTCRGHDYSVISSCYNEICDEMELTLPGSVTLTLTVSGRVVNCNLSNPVGWKATDIEITPLTQHCTSHGKVHHPGSSNSAHLGPFKGSMLVIILSVLCITK
ncbi:hypothetical protein P4O66_014650 [Electrophorus voltai]|uniref:Immunoglobulin subtype domain-containing protein n=1 Tax=Electrophorus voltai TaxID=2609070 RepID=A0AAD8Z3D7_9TELE|nr:hypothetical protein P4O66_014650 [Electrophorus voltai]